MHWGQFAANAGSARLVARSDSSVMHVTVTGSDSRGQLMQSEYWIDDQRSLARVVDATPDGPAIHATSAEWALDIPAVGDRAFRYRVLAAGTGPTVSIRGRLFYYRDSVNSGTGTLISRETGATVVQTADGWVGAFDNVSGLTLWESRTGVRTVYHHTAPEYLSSAAFPTSFFAQTFGRRVAERSETTLAAAAARAAFAFRSPGSAIAGHELVRVLVTEGDSERVLQQINVVYGGAGLEVVQSLLVSPTTLGRPGGTLMTTKLGMGALFKEDSKVSIVLVDGRVATSIFAPNEALALAALSALGGNTP